MTSKQIIDPALLGFVLATSAVIDSSEAQTLQAPIVGRSASENEDETEFAPVRFWTGGIEKTDYWPGFSPDGNRIIFSRRSGSNQPYRLYTVSLKGGEAKPFPVWPLLVGATRANWSWQRNEVAFTGRANGKNQVWLIKGDGTEPHPLMLTNLSPGVAYPAWDREGKYLVVVDYQNDQGGILKRIDIAEGRVTELTQLQKVLAGMPTISPDGKSVAFAGQLNQAKGYDQKLNSIFVLNEQGELQEISAGQGRAPSWSPDGRWIAFESNRSNANGKYALYIVSPEGKQLRKLTPNAHDANHPVWSPDGQSLAFSALNPQTQTLGIATIQTKPE